MDTNQFYRLVMALIDRTKSGELRWVKGSNGGQFIASLTASSVLIEQEWTEFNRDYVYHLSILNEDGETINRAASFNVYGDEDLITLPAIEDLFKVVYAIHYKIDKTYESLKKDLGLDFDIK